MFPLAFGLCADVYLVAVIITRSEAAAVAIALALLAVLGVLWVFLPRRERRVPT
jgi:inner membrane protein involved in colicin E2 resistance